jgi:hypothetical protein
MYSFYHTPTRVSRTDRVPEDVARAASHDDTTSTEAESR